MSFAVRVVLAFAVLASSSAGAFAQHEADYEFATSLEEFCDFYKKTEAYYVDSIGSHDFFSLAMRGVLRGLDPYTAFYSQAEAEEFNSILSGENTGIGIMTRYDGRRRRVVVSYVFPDEPAALAGVRTGDVIMGVGNFVLEPCADNDEVTTRAYHLRVYGLLRGELNEVKNLMVSHAGEVETVEIPVRISNINRPKIALEGMITDSIGYVRVSSCMLGAGEELQNAVVDLKRKGAQQLILDLRDNPGGFVREAVSMVNLFVPKDTLVVRTVGRHPSARMEYRTSADALDELVQLVVLVNDSTASAAEIVAGALQDLDRAIIVGRTTYGKGLVQNPGIEGEYGSTIKLTTGKYFIPSGRCIQKWDYSPLIRGGKRRRSEDENKGYNTLNHRVVLGGGGIRPDIVVPPDSASDFLELLARSEALFNYCIDYKRRHESVEAPDRFVFTDGDYDDFKMFMLENGFVYETSSWNRVQDFYKEALAEGIAPQVEESYNRLRDDILSSISGELDRVRPQAKRVVSRMLMRMYYYDRGMYAYDLLGDRDVHEAVKVLGDRERYSKILYMVPER